MENYCTNCRDEKGCELYAGARKLLNACSSYKFGQKILESDYTGLVKSAEEILGWEELSESQGEAKRVKVNK